MAPLIEIIRYAGLPALIAGLAMGFSVLWPFDGAGPSVDAIGKSATITVGFAFLVLLFGAVLYQVQNETFSGRSAMISGAWLSLPVAIAFVGWVATGMKPETDAFVFGTIALFVTWLGTSAFSFGTIYLLPRIVGTMLFGR
ncbi:hypothetical protein [Aurantiacibacter poecillastricola]|uniref:hypothetical protein n=1 Tax=Aurantiacibacter poecillastricola TaxID=3064385 RepID=UPI00273F587F|nr:hypothetical protein [Aurantiacibacter sp. 219JJ12-13]MDP5262944.1 hypothetical protein [Aurantiacibacter sp. 219JJ12-13]